ncbi:hypothetical protein AVEN_99432-1 [Araneus ventricosus]|uniref:Uncharacterized protein n=1 Tax=Araneus ventricosus TaxID=182803 RepID=A0A4Y2MEE9_ARAVE|nr:hypothetical protein AVEN_99432-1 [Araneus ventricosus]
MVHAKSAVMGQTSFRSSSIQDINTTQVTWETDKLPRSNKPSKTTPKETTVRQKKNNRGPVAGAFTPRLSRVPNRKTTYLLKDLL